MTMIKTNSRIEYNNLINLLEAKEIRFSADYENGSGEYHITIFEEL